MIIKWARVFGFLFFLTLISHIAFLVLKPDGVGEMLEGFFNDSFIGQTLMFLVLPVLLLLALIFTILYAISCAIRWTRRE